MNVNIGDVFVDFSTPIIGRVKKGNLKNKIRFSTVVINVTYNGKNFEITSL